jgi:Secretion system C-terminal sorting domain
MKKFYILLIALFLVNGATGQGSIPALSFDASAQSKHPTLNPQHRTLNSMKNVQGIIGNMVWKTSVIFAENNSSEPIIHRTPQQRLLIQIYDSIYDWGLDTLTNGWKFNTKYTDMVYDANNNLTSETYQIWNGSAWENNEKYTYTYDTNNNRTSELDQSWNGSVWENYNQYINTYDANNNQTSKLGQNWNGSVWENYIQYINTYDANNNKTSELDQSWNGSVWENVEQWLYTYDVINNLKSILAQGWNGTAWVNSWLTTYTYDANNNRTSGLGQNWNGSAWVNYSLTTYTYDASNNLTSELQQSWNGSAWVNHFQWLFTYDANNNLVSAFEQKWDGNAWVNHLKDNLTYDANNFTESESYKYWNNYGTNIVGGDSIYYYFHTVVGVNELMVQDGNIVVYPNPTSTSITIETITKGSLSIHNISGQQLLQQEITEPKTQLDISSLPSGVYFVRVTGEKVVQVGKFVKQ